MEFKEFNQKIKNQFNIMCQTGKLFRVNVTGREIWKLYLESFLPENNKKWRDPESSEHNCNCCQNFIKRYGNIVAIDSNGNLMSLFSNLGDCGEYTDSVKACAEILENVDIKDVFFETYHELDRNLNYESVNKKQKSFLLGVKSNFKQYTQEEVDKFGVVNTEKVYEFQHFNIDLPKQFVDQSGKSIEQIMAFYRDKYQVFKRAMEEIPLDTLNLVKDLINQGSLLDGTAHLHSVEEIIKVIESLGCDIAYYGDSLDNWYWQQTYSMEERVAKFKNTLIGVLCTELDEGMELNKACENWNKRVDPVNYHKATAPITQKQINEAKKFVEENGYSDSFNRRLATIDDIKASEILHMNTGDGKIEQVSIFDSVKPSNLTRHKRAEFDKVEEVSIDKFMKDILPVATSIEAFLENRMESNLVTMTTAVNKDSKRFTKWNSVATNYSWTFNGNLAGKSQIKENVKAVGGNISGVFRCSLQWNDEDTKGIVDFDLHCFGKNHICHRQRGNHSCGGRLDIDMISPSSIGIENIYWSNSIPDGVYNFKVRNFNERSNNGFKVEIEFNGQTFNYFKQGNIKGTTDIATISVRNGVISITHHLPETTSSKELWNLDTNQFHKVNLVCKSPNHWGNNQVGNLHYFFMLDKCSAEHKIRGFHNENLTEDLLKHRKVMEVLGATTMIEPSGKHLAGLGFNSTVKDELIVKVQGSHKRVLKIKF